MMFLVLCPTPKDLRSRPFGDERQNSTNFNKNENFLTHVVNISRMDLPLGVAESRGLKVEAFISFFWLRSPLHWLHSWVGILWWHRWLPGALGFLPPSSALLRGREFPISNGLNLS